MYSYRLLINHRYSINVLKTLNVYSRDKNAFSPLYRIMICSVCSGLPFAVFRIQRPVWSYS